MTAKYQGENRRTPEPQGWHMKKEIQPSGSTDYSFTFAGECPHTVPELMAELGL